MKKHRIRYTCISHTGRYRGQNQDNYYCDKRYLTPRECMPAPLSGCFPVSSGRAVAVFDGLGGEEHGEIAAWIAAKATADYFDGNVSVPRLIQYCKDTNNEICRYRKNHRLRSMGTTCAILGFDEAGISLCNVGDSGIFRISQQGIRKLSKDHVYPSYYGEKAPLTQNLGIDEFPIEPFCLRTEYRDGDIYLLCTDGLTDSIGVREIWRISQQTAIEALAAALLRASLEKGGRDNITVLACRVESEA